MIGFYNYTVYLTYVGLTSSIYGIILAFEGKLTPAVCCLLFSGFCDLFDGKIARTKKDRTDEEKRFGIQIDSLSDVICFGVLPAVIGLALGYDSAVQKAVLIFFVLCGLIRLAYFNVTEEARQQQTTELRKYYLGVPITLSSLLVPVLWCFRSHIGELFPIVYSVLLLILGILFISPIKVKKPGKIGVIALIVVGAAIVLIYLLT